MGAKCPMNCVVTSFNWLVGAKNVPRKPQNCTQKITSMCNNGNNIAKFTRKIKLYGYELLNIPRLGTGLVMNWYTHPG